MSILSRLEQRNQYSFSRIKKQRDTYHTHHQLIHQLGSSIYCIQPPSCLVIKKPKLKKKRTQSRNPPRTYKQVLSPSSFSYHKKSLNMNQQRFHPTSNQVINFNAKPNYRHKKSKAIKINNQNPHSSNTQMMGPTVPKMMNQGSSFFNNNFSSQYGQKSSNFFNEKNSNFRFDGATPFNQSSVQAAAATLAQILHSELTINLTKNEPRMVIYNNNAGGMNPPNNNHLSGNLLGSNSLSLNQNKSSHGPQQHLTANNRHAQFYTQNKNIAPSGLSLSYTQPGGMFMNKAHHHTNQHQQTHSGQQNQRYFNRFKYFRPTHTNNNGQTGALTKNNAPYNTTQFLMYDYSKRCPRLDQECPNEQQQFSDDWNMALATNPSNTMLFSETSKDDAAKSDSSTNEKLTKSVSVDNLHQMDVAPSETMSNTVTNCGENPLTADQEGQHNIFTYSCSL